MEGVGEEKMYFLVFKLAKGQRAHLGQSVSTNFAADCTCETFGTLTRTFDTFIKQKVKLFF